MNELLRPWEVGRVRFVAGIAQTDAERRAAYALRFQAFCLNADPKNPDLHFPPEHYPDGLEHGPEDEDAIHLLIRRDEEESSEFVGCGRLVPGATYIQSEPLNGRPVILPYTWGNRIVRADRTDEPGRAYAPVQKVDGYKDVRIADMLSLAALQVSLDRGSEFWFFGTLVQIAQDVRSRGWPIETFMGPGMFHGAEIEICILELAKVAHFLS